LRDEWGFEGFVTSDWFWGVYDGARGVRAGLDIEMPRAKFYGDNLKALIEAGSVSEAEIDESVRRIVRTKLDFLTREDPIEYSAKLVAAPEHTALAREAAEKSMVLLKNEAGLLPLELDSIGTIAVVGYLADHENTGDRGSSNVSPPYRTSPLQGMRNMLGEEAAILYSDGTDRNEVRRMAERADVVLVVAGSHQDEVGEYISDEEGLRPNSRKEKKPIVIDGPLTAEPIIISGGDRVPLSLQDRDRTVIETACAANDRCIVALIGGSVFTMEEWKGKAGAILMAWYFGMEGGNALARILFGEVNPSGKMPLTTPTDESQLPPFDEFADTTRIGPYHGYTLIDRVGHEPAFPFGFGLSYTTFEYSNLVVRTPAVADDGVVEVTVDVTNTGAVAGEEIVQLYVGFAGSPVERPVKLLRAFDRVALQPGETRTVPLTVEAKDLAWFNPDTMAWEIEVMTYGLFVGPSSATEDLLSASFEVEAEGAANSGPGGQRATR
jgi:beta-glucosidase